MARYLSQMHLQDVAIPMVLQRSSMLKDLGLAIEAAGQVKQPIIIRWTGSADVSTAVFTRQCALRFFQHRAAIFTSRMLIIALNTNVA